MRCVILESPYQGDVDRNVAYARRCIHDILGRNEAPIASHLLFPGILDDTIPRERALGIEAGLAWIRRADAMVAYVDYGISPGMQDAIHVADINHLRVEYRKIGKQGEK
jgi:hypothetical protein